MVDSLFARMGRFIFNSNLEEIMLPLTWYNRVAKMFFAGNDSGYAWKTYIGRFCNGNK